MNMLLIMLGHKYQILLSIKRSKCDWTDIQISSNFNSDLNSLTNFTNNSVNTLQNDLNIGTNTLVSFTNQGVNTLKSNLATATDSIVS